MKILEQTISKNNNPIRLITNNEAKKGAVLVIGVFHGDEPQGNYLINKYLECALSKLMFIPCLNPDGMAANTRQNANGVDLNRNFPTTNWQSGGEKDFFAGNAAASEIETQFLVDVIKKYEPSLILTLHAPFCVVNYDGPAAAYAERVSEIINYPVQADIGYPTPGSFGTYAGVEQQIPVITLELDETIPVEILVEPINKIFEYLETLI